MSGRNANWALVILVAGFVASFPPISKLYLYGLVEPWPAIVRLQIWSITIWAAFLTFAFASPLHKLERDVALRLRPARTVFIMLLAFYLYYLYRGLSGAL